jgi:hypothetical protein
MKIITEALKENEKRDYTENHEFTRGELILDIYNHTANYEYNDETDEADITSYELEQLEKMSNDDLMELMYEYTTWGHEVNIVIVEY